MKVCWMMSGEIANRTVTADMALTQGEAQVEVNKFMPEIHFPSLVSGPYAGSM